MCLLQAAVGTDNAWEFFSRWKNDTWGATLQPTVVYGQPAAAAVVDERHTVMDQAGGGHEEHISTV